MLKLFFSFLMLTVLCCAVCYGETTAKSPGTSALGTAAMDTATVASEQKKLDVVTIAVMSGFVPGLGQIFCGKYLNAFLFMGLETGIGYYGVRSYLDMQEAQKHDANEYPVNSIVNYGELQQRYKSTAITMAILFAGVHVGNIIDAIRSTNEYNSSIEGDREEIKNSRIGAFVYGDGAGIACRIKF